MDTNLEEIDVVILCGGLGKRLRPIISGQPKVLAKIGKKTFLDILIDNLLRYGFRNIILSVGYLKERIRQHFDYWRGCNIIFSEEHKPLGTGGALKKAKSLIKSNPFIVMNGDSICKVNFNEFFDFHISKEAVLSMVLVRSNRVEDYGSVGLDDSRRITGFKEKVAGRDRCLINAGIYLMQKDIFSRMPDKIHFSLEYDLFPKLVESSCYGFVTKSELIDIGTPERYRRAIDLMGS